MPYVLTRRDALNQLSSMADVVIFDRRLLDWSRDEDDVRWFGEEAELVAQQAMEYAQEHYPIVINNEGGESE